MLFYFICRKADGVRLYLGLGHSGASWNRTKEHSAHVKAPLPLSVYIIITVWVKMTTLLLDPNLF